MPGTATAAMDAKLNYIANNAAALHFSSTAPASLTPGAAISGSLGSVAIDATAFTVTAGTSAGDRMLTMATQEITTDPAGGTVRTIVVVDGSGNVLHFWDATERVLNGSQAYTVPALDFNDAAPVNV